MFQEWTDFYKTRKSLKTNRIIFSKNRLRNLKKSQYSLSQKIKNQKNAMRSDHRYLEFPLKSVKKTKDGKIEWSMNRKYDLRWICDTCNKEFNCKPEKGAHSRNDHEGKKYKCYKCGQDFTRDKSFNQHNRENRCDVVRSLEIKQQETNLDISQYSFGFEDTAAKNKDIKLEIKEELLDRSKYVFEFENNAAINKLKQEIKQEALDTSQYSFGFEDTASTNQEIKQEINKAPSSSTLSSLLPPAINPQVQAAICEQDFISGKSLNTVETFKGIQDLPAAILDEQQPTGNSQF